MGEHDRTRRTRTLQATLKHFLLTPTLVQKEYASASSVQFKRPVCLLPFLNLATHLVLELWRRIALLGIAKSANERGLLSTRPSSKQSLRSRGANAPTARIRGCTAPLVSMVSAATLANVARALTRGTVRDMGQTSLRTSRGRQLCAVPAAPETSNAGSAPSGAGPRGLAPTK